MDLVVLAEEVAVAKKLRVYVPDAHGVHLPIYSPAVQNCHSEEQERRRISYSKTRFFASLRMTDTAS